MPVVTLKRCTKCGEEKPATAEFFFRNKQAPDGFNYHCKPCLRLEIDDWKARNAKKLKVQQIAYYKKNREKMRRQGAEFRARWNRVIAEWGKSGCCICGFPWGAGCEAHHRDPSEKETQVGRLTGISLTRELAKCVPSCATHHKLIHAALCNGCASWPLEDIIAKLKREHRAWVLEQAANLAKETL